MTRRRVAQPLGLGLRGRDGRRGRGCARRRRLAGTARLRGAGARGAGAARGGAAARAAARAARRRSREICSRLARRARRARLRQVVPRRRPRLPRRASSTRPTSSRARATRPRSSALLEWADERGRRRRSRTAAAPASSAASRRGSRRATTARLRSTSARSTALLEVDEVSRAALHPAPAPPVRALEQQLGEHGLTLRFFPQSFELSTLGGWIATRAGGHFATRSDARRRPRRVGARDHADRRWESRRLPGSGAGPSAPTGCCSARRGRSA